MRWEARAAHFAVSMELDRRLGRSVTPVNPIAATYLTHINICRLSIVRYVLQYTNTIRVCQPCSPLTSIVPFSPRLSSHLRVDPEEHRVVATEPPLNPPEAREAMAEVSGRSACVSVDAC